MGHKDSLYQLSGTIELDDMLVGVRQKGNRGRGLCKRPVKVKIKKHLMLGHKVHSDTLHGLNFID